jgi:hypothetical protein
VLLNERNSIKSVGNPKALRELISSYEGIALMVERNQLREIRLEDPRREIQKGVESGESTPFDMEELEARGRERLDGH